MAFRMYYIENKLDFGSFDDKQVEQNLQRRRNFVGERDFSSSMLRIMTSLCVSFVRMCSKPLFEAYCYVNEDRLYNTGECHEHPLPFSCSSKWVNCSEYIFKFVLSCSLILPSFRYGRT